MFGYLWQLVMTTIEASFSGTFRTILVLLLVWWGLRMILRMNAQRQAHRSGAGGATQQPHVPRPPGDVRVERTGQEQNRPPGHGPVIIDADFEEIK